MRPFDLDDFLEMQYEDRYGDGPDGDYEPREGADFECDDEDPFPEDIHGDR